MSHLGRKPVRGGRPPIDSRRRAIRGSMVGVLFHRSEAVLMDEKEWGCKIKNIANVNII